MDNLNSFKQDGSQPGLTMTAPTVSQWDVVDKYATGVTKIEKIKVGRTSQLEYGT